MAQSSEIQKTICLGLFLEQRLIHLIHFSSFFGGKHTNMGVSENSVPLNPMVNDHYPY